MRTKLVGFLLIVLTAQGLQTGQSAQLPPASEMKTVGLIGGTAWYSTVDYYRYINKAINDAYGNNTNPPLIVYNLNQQKIQDLQAQNQWDEIAAMNVDAATRLRRSGVASHPIRFQYAAQDLRSSSTPCGHSNPAHRRRDGNGDSKSRSEEGRADWHKVHHGRRIHGRLA